MRKVIHKNGTPGNDTFYASTNDDYYYSGRAGSDIIVTLAGNDRLNGDAGQDLVDGGQGNDIIHGGAGYDDLRGEEGKDRLYGDSGNDILYGGMDRDILRGGVGKDSFVFFTNNLTGRGSDLDIVKDFTVKGRNADYLGMAVAGTDGVMITTYDDLVPYMSQRNGDVHIAFDSGDTLIIENVRLRQINEDHFIF
ncbi:calcium-binding protein [Rhizobium sp. KVB221]|uniref:Calcium-binding protein n=1 Tax=Rhizobium setariae TaxID=2801340 RepID=A0A937CJJ3_9HYPH|nr:calcium-binding protein [Rhizobium setariae]MBL0371165.1 calcium-binding protein [Rhizobium setariae]